MKKGYIVLIVIAVVVLSIFFWFKGAYNGMVNMREAVSAQWCECGKPISTAPGSDPQSGSIQ